MRLFGRKDEEEHEPGLPGDHIAEFWVWWEQTRPQLDSLVATGEAGLLSQALTPAVAAIHPGLVYEIAPGRSAAHALVVTAAGDAELRSLAHRWAAAAPPADFLWEFFPSRQANSRALETTLDVGGHAFELDKLMFGLRVPRGAPRIDIAAYHPIFAELDEDTRMDTALLALDWILGEDEVARWVGDLTAATFQPIDAVPALHLPAVVADVSSEWSQEQWAVLEGQAAGGAPLLATTRYPLRPVDYPLFDQHIEITLPYSQRDDNGLPGEASLEALRDFEERLTARLAGAHAVLAVHVSAEGQRAIHVYADPAGDAAAVARELADGWREGEPRVEVAPDPGWISVSPFLS